MKAKTNRQILTDLIKNADELDLVIIRERLLKVADLTLDAIKKNPTSFDNPIFSHNYYIHVSNMIIKSLNTK